MENPISFQYTSSKQSQLFIGHIGYASDKVEDFLPQILHLDFQTGGMMCTSVKVHAIPLQKNKSQKYSDLGEKLDSIYFDSLYYQPNLVQINEYSELLAQFQLSCNESYMHYQEGFYPFDLSENFLQDFFENYGMNSTVRELFIIPKSGFSGLGFSKFFGFFAGLNSD
jgi:hypothetical protein